MRKLYARVMVVVALVMAAIFGQPNNAAAQGQVTECGVIVGFGCMNPDYFGFNSSICQQHYGINCFFWQCVPPYGAIRCLRFFYT